jgi:SpoVK/Ycf46/Vps4 family AAA+-type ATPase
MDQLGTRLIQSGNLTEQQLESALRRQLLHGGRIGENLLALGHLAHEEVERIFNQSPTPPISIDDSGLDITLISELVLKHLLFTGELKMVEIAERVKLPLYIVDSALEILRQHNYVEFNGDAGDSSSADTGLITDTGKNRASELMDLCRYVGPAPVNLSSYQEMVELQTVMSIMVSEESVRQAFSHLVIDPRVIEKIGPALSSGRAIFLYGPPGNGKSTIAETVGRLLSDSIYIPYAITVGGQIITVFDPVCHVPVDNPTPLPDRDQRWVRIKRPVVITGGELILPMLDLDFNPVSRYYEASLQMKANNGIFIIDDFGRQQIEPHQLLNRWTVPLDRGIDFMTLQTGMKFSIPFNMLVIFATNIEPAKLVDEAFLRRIPYKIKIDQPGEEDFCSIFSKVCAANGIDFSREAYNYLLEEYYGKTGTSFNACHPRDIIEHIVRNARYFHRKTELTPASIDEAWSSYFVEE